MASKVLCIFIVIFLIHTTEIKGHGMLLDPPSRSSRWRFDSSAPVNYNDNSLWCGGLDIQWKTHGGKCGLCGDDYGLPTPRPNEIGGLYGGTGVITKTYCPDASSIHVQFNITANHRGFVYFNLCNLDEYTRESEECYLKHHLKFIDGSDRFPIGTKTGSFGLDVVLPKGVSCKHCVLRWTYNAGNNWGKCADGTSGMGCGPHENYKNCADISIKTVEKGQSHSQPAVITEKPIKSNGAHYPIIPVRPIQSTQHYHPTTVSSYKPTEHYHPTTVSSYKPTEHYHPTTVSSYKPTESDYTHIRYDNPPTKGPVICDQHLKNELFTEEEVNQLTLDLVTKLGPCSSRDEQFRVLTQLAIKYLYTNKVSRH